MLELQQVEVNQTIDYTYDPLNRLTSAVYDNGNFYQYTYDAVGNRLTETTLEGTDTYIYNNNNWVVQKNDTSWSYDGAGNLRYDGVRSYDYDAANRLQLVSDRSAYVQTRYAYNGLGDRLQSMLIYYPTGEITTTNYTLDLNTNLTQVLADGSNTYTYGYNRIAQISDTQTGYFLGDALGSVRQVADETGAVNLVQSYSPYGEVLSSVGEYETAFSYTGEMTDATGLVYLRARYYDPGTGRFVNKDTWGGDYNNPITLAKWLYANGNPVVYVDPSGYSSVQSRTGNEVIKFLLEKITTDSQSEAIITIKNLNSTDYYAKACDIYDDLLERTKYGNNSITQYLLSAATTDSINKVIATASFGCLVADGRTRPLCGQWDYKVDISAKWGNFQTVDFSDIGIPEKVVFYYDIWANIHFGYLGLAGGFSIEQLTNGAAIENGISNGSFIFQDDPSDLSANWIGFAFYQNNIPLTYSTFLGWLYAMQPMLNKVRDNNGKYEIYR